ncbi:hypothetical protein BELL_0640g00020 [Botrytis elliptica]|uniref:Uncharacterized protein n=1 Tax=Botrytis elliptica TaxID=278938 RepID=A0A4Z1JPZ9_9HELO|nr:hypothetical protein BELL_0640g00020 [Botrytis elliptica]
MVDVELTDVEMKSQRSQPSVQSASIKGDSSSDENKSQSSLPSGGPDPTGKHPESSVAAHSVEADLDNKDEDLITLPAAKLEEWLKHGIRILRENRQRTKAAGSDPEYEALDNEPENPGPQHFETSSLPDRIFDTPIDGQLLRQSINKFLSKREDQQWFTATQRKFVDPFFDRVRRNPFYFKEINADLPLKITIDRNGLMSDFQLSDFKRFGRVKTSEPSFDILWQKYFGKLFEFRHSMSVAHGQWSVTVRKAWLGRRLFETNPWEDSIPVGICCAQMLCNGDTHGGDLTIGSVLSYCFDTGSLKEIGGLQLVWTDVLEEHFLLNPGTKQLFVTFFGSVEEFIESFAGPSSFSWGPSGGTSIWNAFDPTSDSETYGPRIIDGVHKTWDLLNSASKDRRKLYRSIAGKNGWPTERLWKDTGTITSSEYSFLDSYHDVPSFTIRLAILNNSEVSYRHFGPLEHRVRILREYMDRQKPRGFRQLWRDSRDSFNYYTFWGVIIFGVVSIFLAMASLAVSISQTYASFKSLG